MRHVEVTWTVPASVSEVRAKLTPEAIVAAECGHEPTEVTTVDGQTVVTGHPAGRILAPRYVFESVDGGFRYRRDDERPMAATVETTVDVEPRDGETEIRFRSTVTPRVPVPMLDRFVAWRRGRTLSRVRGRLTDALR